MLKRILLILIVAASSLVLVWLTLVSAGIPSMAGLPEQAAELHGNLVAINIVLGLLAVVIAFFPQVKFSVLVFVLQCAVFGSALYNTTTLAPAEREQILRANYRRINTRLIAEAGIVLECAEGYRVAYLPPVTNSSGRTIAELHLVPANFDEEPHQLLNWVDGMVGEVFIKASHQHLAALLPGCRNATTTFDALVEYMQNLESKGSE